MFVALSLRYGVSTGWSLGANSGSNKTKPDMSVRDDNTVPDQCDIANGLGSDCNNIGLLDVCEPELALDIPHIVGVLPGSNVGPVDVCLADANRDSQTNTLDIQPFVDTLLVP